MTDLDEQRQQLQQQLADLERVEREEIERKRQAEVAEREAALDPKSREQKAAIEQAARDALDREWPPAWQPQKNSSHPPEIIGLVLRIDPRVGPSKTFGTYSAVIEVRATDGQEWTLWANESGALYAQLVRLRVQPGEVVGIRYRGKKESTVNPGQYYQDFRLVRVEEDGDPGRPVDYDQLGRNHDTPALPTPETQQEPYDDIPF